MSSSIVVILDISAQFSLGMGILVDGTSDGMSIVGIGMGLWWMGIYRGRFSIMLTSVEFELMSLS